ncbi:MAG: hypothetical protein NZ874_00945 [Fimbriimonadales bacterium]|nr:hypothetical protein [Fimbriimonadales bacterium]
MHSRTRNSTPSAKQAKPNRSTDSRVRAAVGGTPTLRIALDKTVQATLRLGETPKPLRGTGILPVQA